MTSKQDSDSVAATVASSINDGKTHLLFASSGSVATIKLPQMIGALGRHPNLSIRIILTKSATEFLAGQAPEQPTVASLSSLPNVDGVHVDEDEWSEPWTRNAPILHIELRRWSHLLVVAPLSANILAKLTAGICDDLLTCVVRAWDVENARNQDGPTIFVAPSMNTMMWTHPLTARQLSTLGEWSWFKVLMPQVKALACGDVGQGGMMEWPEIVAAVEHRLNLITLSSSDASVSNPSQA